MAVGAAGAMELVGIQRPRGRDLATGIVLGAGFGLAALFLYLGTIYDNSSGATISILFGSILTLDPSVPPLVLAFGAIVLVIIGACTGRCCSARSARSWPRQADPGEAGRRRAT